MAMNGEQREVAMPLDAAVEETPDTGRDDDGGGDDGESSGEPSREAQRPGQQSGKPTRKEQRQGRREDFRMREEFGGMKATIASQNAQMAALQRKLDEIANQGARQPAQQRAETPAASPIDQRIETLKMAMKAEVKAFRAHDPSKGDYDTSRYEAIKDQLDDARHEKNMDKFFRDRGIDPNAKPRQDPRMGREEVTREAENTVRRETVYNEFPWLDPRRPGHQAQYMKAFRATAEYLEEGEGRPGGINTDREAAAMVAAKFRIPGQRRPASAPPRMPFRDNHRGRGDEGGGNDFEVPAAQLEGHGLSAEALQRAARRARGG